MAAGNTLKFTLICIPLLVAVSLLLAVVLQRLRFAKNTLKSGFLIPVAVPAASVVLVWKVLFHSNGLINGRNGPCEDCMDDERRGVSGAGDQLPMEEYRVRYDSLDGRACRNSE